MNAILEVRWNASAAEPSASFFFHIPFPPRSSLPSCVGWRMTWINMHHISCPLIYSARFAEATLSRVTLSRAFLCVPLSYSHLRLLNTCHCQSKCNKTQMICSFGLIKSPCLFALQSLCRIIAAPPRWKAAGCLGDKMRIWRYEGFVALPLSLPSHS